MNRKVMKVVLAIILLTGLLLSACQPQTQTATPAANEDQNPAQVVEPTKAETEPTVAVGSNVVEITYMRQADNSDIELEYIAEFEAANPGIKVNVDSVPSNDTYSKLVLTTNAGNPPDVFMTFWTADAVSNNLIYPLDEFVDRAEFDKRFTTAGASYATYQGKIYAIPWRAGASAFLINCQMFKDAGLEVPTLGWTWDDLASLAAKITDKSKGTYGFGLVGSSTDFATEWQFWPFLLQAGGKIYENNRAAFNTPEGVKALEYLISLAPSIPEGYTSMDMNQMLDLFASNKVAMFEDGPWYIGVMQNAHPDMEVCVAPMTVGALPGNIAGGTALGISPLSKNKEAAWKFIQFMTSDDVLARWNVATNNVPPVVSALELPLYQEGPMSIAAEAAKQPGVIPANQYPESTRLNTIMRTYLQAAYLGEMTPKEALDQAAAEWNEVLKNYD